jgi:hypothetical protein
MKRPLAALTRLPTVFITSAILVLVVSCTTSDPATSAKIRDLAFWCHDNLGITEVHSKPMDDCIRRNWDRDTSETTIANQ